VTPVKSGKQFKELPTHYVSTKPQVLSHINIDSHFNLNSPEAIMKKALKIIGVLIGIGLVVAIAGYFYLRKTEGMEKPQGQAGPAAEALADKMLAASGADAWSQTRYVTWTFAGSNTYIWDRSEAKVIKGAGEHQVMIDANTGEVIGGSSVSDAEAAWSNFCNDSFWLIAPLKVKDPGTSRELVSTAEGDALMVHYPSGGVTPGDSYLWYLAEDGLPYAYRMWTQILPLPGMKSTWEGWETIHTGAKIATRHEMGPMTLEITNLKTGSTLTEIGLPENTFD